MPRGKKKEVTPEVEPTPEVEVVTPPTEAELLVADRTRVNELVATITVEGAPVPGELHVKLGRINQRLKELGVD